MRPGTIWFIKDLSEQNLRPTCDILERPALVQLCKVSVSVIMHGLVVACGVGSIEELMRLGRGVILPSSLETPMRTRAFFSTTSTAIWKYLCAWLRLTSYMFGEHHPEEEHELPTLAAGCLIETLIVKLETMAVIAGFPTVSSLQFPETRVLQPGLTPMACQWMRRRAS